MSSLLYVSVLKNRRWNVESRQRFRSLQTLLQFLWAQCLVAFDRVESQRQFDCIWKLVEALLLLLGEKPPFLVGALLPKDTNLDATKLGTKMFLAFCLEIQSSDAFSGWLCLLVPAARGLWVQLLSPFDQLV